MKPILVAYCTNAGSTTDVAVVIGEGLGNRDVQAHMRWIRDVADLRDMQPWSSAAR
jgi:flavodoxin